MVLDHTAYCSSATCYTGPGDTDPPTAGELSLLLAIPRAAESTPHASLFRLPRGPDPSMGWIDVTCAETYSIVSRLASTWKARLCEMLGESKVGPGTTICIMVHPPVRALFHLLAFWALGCTAQFFSPIVSGEHADLSLRQSGCKVLLHSGMDDGWVEGQRAQFGGTMVELAADECALQLAQAEEENNHMYPSPPWPEPRRPTPAVIIQSSGTTGAPKLLKFSLYFYTVFHAANCRNWLSLAGRKVKTPHTHPCLIFSYSFWQSFFLTLFVHLGTATPLAFPYNSSIPMKMFTHEQFMAWAQALDAGSISCATAYIREIPPLLLQKYAEFLQSLYSITVYGSIVDDATSDQWEAHKLLITASTLLTQALAYNLLQNLFGMSELGRLLYAHRAPFTHLRPYSDTPLLVYPLSEPNPDGSRQVQLWTSVSGSPRLAHLAAYGGVPLNLESFPGEGPHHGELAFNWGDVFLEVQSSEIAYIYLGRADDHIRLGGTDVGNINALRYEQELWSVIESRFGAAASRWAVDAIQLFGGNTSCTALVVQLARLGQADLRLDDATLQELASAVEALNTKMQLGRGRRVHPGKRMLVVSLDGGVYGPGAETLADERPQLMMTHKRTLQRWKNVQIFKKWLDQLDFSEP